MWLIDEGSFGDLEVMSKDRKWDSGSSLDTSNVAFILS